MPRGLSTISSKSSSFVFADEVGAEPVPERVASVGDLKPALLPMPLSIFAFASEAFVGRIAPGLLPDMTLAHKRLIFLTSASGGYEFSECGLGFGRVCEGVGRDGAGKGRNRSLLRAVRLRMDCPRRKEVAAVGFA